MHTSPSTRFYFHWLLALVFSSCGPSSQSSADTSTDISIAVAANMQFAMPALTEAFTQQTGIACQTSISSSGKLTAQIQQGAPFDVFVAANMKYPDEIVRTGLAASPSKIYARGKLVLWSMKADFTPSLVGLRDASVRHIALANPKVAPYGMAAEEVLQGHGLLPELEAKLVFGESIAQTNQFITTQSAEVGFTAMSVVLSPSLKDKGQWVAIPTERHAPIEQGVVVIKKENGIKPAAMTFYEFLFSPSAKAILQEFGYEVEGI